MTRTIAFSLVLFTLGLNGIPQDISVTFTGTGAATRVDSVTATNLTTHQSVTLPGNETLVLNVKSGIQTVSELPDKGIVYPNPFSGRATITAPSEKPQSVNIKAINLFGQVVAQTDADIQPGKNEFSLSVSASGIYLVILTYDEGTAAYKVICTGTAETGNSIHYLGPVSNNPNNHDHHNPHNTPALKTFYSGYALGYTTGEVIHYRFRSGVYTSILTDSPAFSKNYEVVFADCADPDGKKYSIVKIGTQTWMAENLAWLPSVNPPGDASETGSRYYVYNYDGGYESVGAAKADEHYAAYGVLYNWVAAKTACPGGWHLPADTEWMMLETYLGMSQSEADSTGWRWSGSVGRALKYNSVWDNQGYGSNSSGFGALPGGNYAWNYSWHFQGVGFNAEFWSSSEGGAPYAWGRYLGDIMLDGVGRGKYEQTWGLSVRCLQN
jgi:uncharacterized protein (TIGR02145 family)